jgi:PAS domain S-box-containing protein
MMTELERLRLRVAELEAMHAPTVLQQELEEANRHLEQRVARHMARLLEAHEIARIGSWELDVATEQITLSEQAQKILGMPAEQASLAAVLALLHPGDVDHLQAVVQTTDYSSHSAGVEARVPQADGSTVHIAVRSRRLSSDGDLDRLVGTVQDITAQKLAQQQQERLFVMAENTSDFIGAATRQGKLIYLNRAARTFMGLAANADLSNLTIADCHPPAAYTSIQSCGIPTAIEYGSWSGDTAWRGANGREVPTSQVLVAHYDAHGQVEYLSTIARNISLQQQAAAALQHSRDELQAANKALEQAARLKDEFLASVSHELRTPLTGVLAMAEALQTESFGALNARQQHLLQRIEDSGRHLLAVITDILDLSRIDAGTLELNAADCVLQDLCGACVHVVADAAAAKHQSIHLCVEPQSLHVEADPRRLRQMLVNLLDNAVKFTPECGSLGLQVTACSDDSAELSAANSRSAGRWAHRQPCEAEAGSGSIRFVVWDTGVGIPAEEHTKLFLPFSQVDGSLTRRYSGTGLGLALVKRIAELHGGHVSVDSAPGKGSRFSITLPRTADRGSQQLKGVR